jgi:hypothetical protein
MKRYRGLGQKIAARPALGKKDLKHESGINIAEFESTIFVA